MSTPLHYAVDNDHTDAAELLIIHGANVNMSDLDMKTPLHLVKNIDLAKLLIDHGANINAECESNWLPIHCATYIGKKDIVSLLIQNGSKDDTFRCKGNKEYSVYIRDGVVFSSYLKRNNSCRCVCS